MGKIITKREFVCDHCGFVKTLKDNEFIDKCPACNDGENKGYYHEEKYKWKK